MKRIHLATGLILLLCAAAAAQTWSSYGGDPGGARFSSLSQIKKGNVARLKVAWTFHTGDVSDGKDGRPKSKFEVTPILFNDTLYASTPFNRVIALNPEDGSQRWSYDPKIDLKRHYSESLVSRGVSAWEDKTAASPAACRRRIFLATLDARLIALDASSGKPCEGFGTGGSVDLTQGVGNVDLLMIAIDSGKDKMVYAGPLLSHYEFEMPGMTRKGDSEWKKEIIDGKLPPRPEWTKSYLVPGVNPHVKLYQHQE